MQHHHKVSFKAPLVSPAQIPPETPAINPHNFVSVVEKKKDPVRWLLTTSWEIAVIDCAWRHVKLLLRGGHFCCARSRNRTTQEGGGSGVISIPSHTDESARLINEGGSDGGDAVGAVTQYLHSDLLLTETRLRKTCKKSFGGQKAQA